MQSSDTIFALSSGSLPAGVAVVRLSGPAVQSVLTVLLGLVPPPRLARYGAIRSRNDRIIDRGLAMFFPAPNSFSGEDCAELHLHGGRAVLAEMFRELSALPDMRHAEPGEFTKRAFLNNKLDLVETEALADLIAAETETQRRLAVSGAGGSQSGLYASWRERLLHAQAMIEAEFDFSDESDVPGSVADAVWVDISALIHEIGAHIGGYRRAEIIKEGFQVVILGAPNAGKSSLINALARRPVALVSEEAGTTRDLIEVALDLDGCKVVLTDTAGIRPDPGRIEAMGIDLAIQRAKAANLVLLLEAPGAAGFGGIELGGVAIVRVATKADLAPASNRADLTISALTGSGLEALLATLSERARSAAGDGRDIFPSQARHVELLELTMKALHVAVDNSSGALELRAEELRKAAYSLGQISGRIDTEHLLDVIFGRFCIGK